MRKELKNWEKETNKLKDIFVKKYFGDSANDVYWIGDEIGFILCVNDYFFDLQRIGEAIKYNASVKRFFEYHNKELELAIKNKKMDIAFRNYLKLKK